MPVVHRILPGVRMLITTCEATFPPSLSNGCHEPFLLGTKRGRGHARQRNWIINCSSHRGSRASAMKNTASVPRGASTACNHPLASGRKTPSGYLRVDIGKRPALRPQLGPVV
eukprot:2034770-Pyramimonas_sp.AAC.1